MQIDFLKNKPQFIDEIAIFWNNEWSRNQNPESLEKQRQGILAKANIGKVPFIIVAYEGNTFYGSAALFEKDLESMSELLPWLAGVFVKKEYRGQGIASQLFLKIALEAKKLGFEKIYLHTETASGLYEKLGCRKIGETINDNDEKTFVFELDLEKY